MGTRYYTATFRTRHPSYPKEPYEEELTVLLEDIHPAVFVASYPHYSMEAGPLLHWAPLDPAEAEAVFEAYRAMGAVNRVYAIGQVHGLLAKYVRSADAEGWSAIGAKRRIAGLEAYAQTLGIELAKATEDA